MPGTTFPIPKGATLRPEEDVILALPSQLISGDETIGSILLCDDDVELTLNDKVGAWYIKLRAGMTLALGRSCEIMLIGRDDRPRFFQYLAPEVKVTEGAAPNGGLAPPLGNSGVSEGPPSAG
jgi:hypothetical protein